MRAPFTVIGERNGATVRVTWDNGQVYGTGNAASRDTAEWIRQLAAMYEGRSCRGTGAVATTHDHLRSPHTAYAIICSVFPGRTQLDGTLPPLLAPPGAVI
jgi:hypothetical protein